MGWKGLASRARTHKRKLTVRRRHAFVIEKHIEDAKQNENSVLDLLESIMRPTDPVKEELRPILFNINKFRPKNTKILKFKIQKLVCRSPLAHFEAAPFPTFAIFGRTRAKYSKKYGF